MKTKQTAEPQGSVCTVSKGKSWDYWQGAKGWYQSRVTPGKITIQVKGASHPSGCWTFDWWQTKCGPEGDIGHRRPGAISGNLFDIGAMICALSSTDLMPLIGKPGYWEACVAVFSSGFYVGREFEILNPVDGFLYTIMNDTCTYGESNEGGFKTHVSWESAEE